MFYALHADPENGLNKGAEIQHLVAALGDLCGILE